jgi:two-component system CheB/CheR fusion protein
MPSADQPAPDPSVHDTLAPSHFVGIGASAGGLEALETFFDNMSADSGLAFVVVQHLSPQYKSLMAELLSKHTLMPVHRVEDGMCVKVNSVYLIPPKMNLTIFHGKLLLKEQDHTQGINLPIDVFFRSLAEDQGEKAIAIVLSGTGSDGMRGVRSVKESGGMVMVQDEASAKFDGMPRSAISTGLADFILPPANMPGQLLNFIKHPYVAKTGRDDTLLSDEDNLTRIFALLREKTGVDFTYYKPSTVIRRIERRMTINQIKELKYYVRHMEKSSREVLSLYRELLIGVTSFFRDPTAYETLAETVLPRIFENATDGALRLWVAGCSTGEEAYSLAILCREHMETTGRAYDVKIFATDIDRNAVEQAGNGMYPESIAADVSPQRLTRYFNRQGDMYQVSRSIREMVVFAPHNILRDPPFTRTDLVSCRNLLIYLQPVLQKKAFSLFQFSLKPGGFLFLGTSETVGDMTAQFELLDGKWKIYRARATGKRPMLDSHLAITEPMPMAPRTARFAAIHAAEDERLLERLLEGVSTAYLPPGVVINERGEVVHVIGDVRKFFSMPPGKVSAEINRLAEKDLAIPLATGIQKVLRTNNEVRYKNIRLSASGGGDLVHLRISPLPGRKGFDRLITVFVEDTHRGTDQEAAATTQTYDIGREAEQRINDLEQELQYTKENLQATIEELETSNEELQATNEELLASNEELQSTNEELQSVNEELYTVNAEFQAKIQELSDLNNDVDNLLRSTEIETIFIDDDMTIRKFTPAMKRVFTMGEHDIGRPAGHLAHNLKNVDLPDIIRRVLETNTLIEQEVETADHRWFLLRALPYRTDLQTTSGTVIAFVDISEVKRNEAIQRRENMQRQARIFAENIIDSLQTSLLVLDTELQVITVNHTFCQTFGLEKETSIHKSFAELGSGLWELPEFAELLSTVVKSERAAGERPFVHTPAGKRPRHFLAAARPMQQEDGAMVSILVTLTETSAESAAS